MNEIEGMAKVIGEYGVLAVIAVLFLLLAYKMFKSQQNWLEKLISDKISSYPPRPSKEEINALDVINGKIYQELRGLINALRADRTYVFLYHNGGASTSGLHFQKMSCICEVVSQGILPVADQKQAIYRASYTMLCDRLKNDGHCFIHDVYALKGKDDFMYQVLVARHSESSYYKALRDSQNNVIGFLGVDYCSLSDSVSETEISKLLKTVSLKLSSLVDIRDEVKEN